MKSTEKYGKKIDAALSLWVKLARAYSTVNRKSTESINRFRLTEGQFGVLETLGHLGPLTIGMLCKKQLVSGGNMTLVLDNMEREGLVKRVPSKNDRRAIIIELTDKGKNLFDETFIQHANDIAEIMDVLTDKEISTLSELLKKLGTSLG